MNSETGRSPRPARAESASSQDRTARDRSDRPIVLLVDSRPSLQILYEQELRRAGFQALIASDGDQGLASIETGNVDLVVLDLRLPGHMDGVELLRRILEHDATIPVIINTAYAGDLRKEQLAAADAILIKSSDLTPLLERIRELTRSRRSGTEPVIQEGDGRHGQSHRTKTSSWRTISSSCFIRIP